MTFSEGLNRGMGLLQAGSVNDVPSMLSGKKAAELYLELCFRSGILPTQLTRQDKKRILMMMDWFNHMATEEEKVSKGKIRRFFPEH